VKVAMREKAASQVKEGFALWMSLCERKLLRRWKKLMNVAMREKKWTGSARRLPLT